MFNVDHAEKTISTMTKSGCCWHQYSDFIVKQNRPVVIKIVEESVNVNGFFLEITEQNRINGKLRRKEHSVFTADFMDPNVFFSFEFSNKKILRLLNHGGELNYVFTDKDNKIELHYSGLFSYAKDENALKFKSGNTNYTISENGVVVTSSKVNADMEADPATIKGSLSEMQRIKFENVIYQ
jgi:hypothetical protein